MLFYANFFAYCATWIAHLLFFAGLLPQIKLNFKIKSTRGLSDLLIIGYLNGYISYLFYVFCLHLPLNYRTIVPIATLAMLVIVFQRFYYTSFKTNKKEYLLLLIYILNILLAILLIPIAQKHPFLTGTISGWIMALIWATYQIPQVIKIFAEKSTFGFSFALATMIGIGDLLELFAAIILKLPIPTLLNDIRGVGIYLIFCLQFFLYKKQ